MAEMKESSGNGGSLSDPLQEAMRRIQDVEKTGSSDLDLSSLGLGPVLRGDWDGWEALQRLDKLQFLNLADNQITDIPAEGWAALGRLVGLCWLDLKKNQIKIIPAEGWQAIGHLDALEALNLTENSLVGFPEGGWEVLGRMPQ